jgi:prepilin-type N-terminal cleavage/methylation domain-containing protein
MKNCRLPIADCRLRRTPRNRAGASDSIVNRQSKIANGFTLVELLVVISIMGLLAALAVPALKNLGKSNAQTSASRQLLDDIGRARQFAISQHTTVYMVFVPTNFFNTTFQNGLNSITLPADQFAAWTTVSNLLDKQLSGYNFISKGQVGDQPGQHVWHYLSTWQSLPEGTFIAASKFQFQTASTPNQSLLNDYPNQIDNWRIGTAGSQIYPFTNSLIPFPTEQSPWIYMPCLVFDSTGKLISETPDGVIFHHAYIPLAQGSVGYGYDAKKQPTLTAVQPKDITEIPVGNSASISYNVIDVDPLSGRAKLLVHHIP